MTIAGSRQAMRTPGSLTDALRRPLALPCGAVLKHRLVKSAMSDSLGNGSGDPTPAQARLYERWAQGGIALSIIGEVQGDPRFPERPGNLVLGRDSSEESFQALTGRATVEGAHLWAQLGHAGALSHLPISRPRGPSALDLDGLACSGMSHAEVQAIPDRFASTATHAQALGFSGVEIHAAHGFLLSQFLSPLFNHRADHYGGSIGNRCRIVMDVVDSVRDAVGPDFPIAIKLNATDQLEGGLDGEEALEVVRRLDSTSVDLIDISGGTYFPGARATSDASGSGPYFIEFARRARLRTSTPLMLTGGFKTHAQAATAVAAGDTDLIGLARAMVLEPMLPRAWLAKDVRDPVFPRFDTTPPGGVTAWYTLRLTALAEDREEAFSHDLESAIRDYEARDARRCASWLQAFGNDGRGA